MQCARRRTFGMVAMAWARRTQHGLAVVLVLPELLGSILRLSMVSKEFLLAVLGGPCPPLLAVLANAVEAAGVAGVLLQLHRPCDRRDGEEQGATRAIGREQHLQTETRDVGRNLYLMMIVV